MERKRAPVGFDHGEIGEGIHFDADVFFCGFVAEAVAGLIQCLQRAQPFRA